MRYKYECYENQTEKNSKNRFCQKKVATKAQNTRKNFLYHSKLYEELWECYAEAKFLKILCGQKSRPTVTKLAKIFYSQEKQISTGIELPGFVVSSMGVAVICNKAELLSYGNQAGKNKTDDSPIKQENSSLQKRAWPDSNHKLLPSNAVVLPLHQMCRMVDWI